MPRRRFGGKGNWRGNKKMKKDMPYGAKPYDPYFGMSGVNKNIRMRPSIYMLKEIRKYEKGEQIRIKPFALHDLVVSFTQNLSHTACRTTQEMYRLIESFIMFFIRREVNMAKAYGVRIVVAPKDMLLAHSIGNDFY